MPRLRLVLVLVAALAPASLVAQKRPAPKIELGPIAPLTVAHLLDTYSSGQFDEAVQAVAKAGDAVGRNLRAHFLESPGTQPGQEQAHEDQMTYHPLRS